MRENCTLRDSFQSHNNVDSLPVCSEISTSDTHEVVPKAEKQGSFESLGSKLIYLSLSGKNRENRQIFQ